MKKSLVLLVSSLSFYMQAQDGKHQLQPNEKSHEIVINIKVNCPMSVEFEEFVKSIPPEGSSASNFEEWKTSFVNNMNQLIRLVESEQVLDSCWSVNADYP